MADVKISPNQEDTSEPFQGVPESTLIHHRRDKSELSIFQKLIDARGSGKEVWNDEGADDYVNRLRTDSL